MKELLLTDLGIYRTDSLFNKFCNFDIANANCSYYFRENMKRLFSRYEGKLKRL